MLKKFFRRWHYGVKAKVIDGALVAHIDTSVEPVFIRFDLARLQSVLIDVTHKNGDYELILAGIGAPAATTTLARFEVRDAAEEAAASLRCALLRGNYKSGFRPAFRFTMGVLAALLFAALLAMLAELLTGGTTAANLSSASHSMLGEMAPPASGIMDLPAVKAEPGEPQSAEEFLGQ